MRTTRRPVVDLATAPRSAAAPAARAGAVILVISHPGDPHATRVVEALQRAGREVLLFDLSALPDRAGLTIDYADPRRPAVEYRPVDGPPVDLGRTTAVWWRRPQVADVSGVDGFDARLFTANEWNEAINGLWLLLDVPWCNPPARDDMASRKAYQLRVAAEVGLAVPPTLITSDPDRARAFIDRHGVGRTIFKTFSATHEVWRETRIVRDEELGLLDAVRMAPVIFQAYVEAEADLRVTFVGDRIFPAAIDARATDYPVDFRMSLGQATTSATVLPPEVEARLRTFMRRLGLVYGAIDLRRTPAGEHVFLEINTAGEFLFIEERTGQPITQAMADWLSDPSNGHRDPGVVAGRDVV
jgi:glutathione synthase/RimK-type ligase-like ATP-grasp enzyme